MAAEQLEVRALTGIRPTGGLQVGNLVGAMEPLVAMQETFTGEISAFVADVHGLTTEEGPDIVATRLDTARSWLAAGVDPVRTDLYVQSSIEPEVLGLDRILQRHATVAELNLMPSVKEDLRTEGVPVNQAKYGYPTLMAADIIGQRATHVPVGEDQMPHIELTREIVRRFNAQYGGGEQVLVMPEVLAMQAVRILSLSGRGKMSKSDPSQMNVIYLHDTPDAVAAKIKRARTAAPGEESEALDSLFLMSEALSMTEADLLESRRLQAAHAAGEGVMREFKPFLTDVVNARLGIFQARYADLSETHVRDVLLAGAERARDHARGVLVQAREAMGFSRFSGTED